MVFAHALLGVDEYRGEEAAVLEGADELVMPDSFRAELADVLWQWVRHRGVSLELARSLLWDAEALIARVLDSGALWERALSLAVMHNHPVYDTLFVAAAELSQTHVVTFDRRLKKAFPRYIVTASEFLRGGGAT